MIQLGTRWAIGSQPPARLSPEVVDAITRTERILNDSNRSDIAGAVWTLTWLEGRPIAELDRDGDDGEPITVTVDVTGHVVGSESAEADDDTW